MQNGFPGRLRPWKFRKLRFDSIYPGRCMHIASILEEQFIALKLPAKTKEEALNSMVDLFKGSPKVLDLEKIRAAILEREKIMSTGVGHGFAIPHGKTDALTDIIAAFAITEE